MSPRNRRAYLDDYRPTADGGYEYTGAVWHWAPPEARRPLMRRAAALLSAAFVCMVAAGFLPAPGVGYAAYVLLPYAVALVAAALATASLLRLARAGDEVRDHVYQASVPRLPGRLLVGCIAAIASALGQLVHLALSGGAPSLAGIAFALLMAAAAACLALLCRAFSDIPLAS